MEYEASVGPGLIKMPVSDRWPKVAAYQALQRRALEPRPPAHGAPRDVRPLGERRLQQVWYSLEPGEITWGPKEGELPEGWMRPAIGYARIRSPGGGMAPRTLGRVGSWTPRYAGSTEESPSRSECWRCTSREGAIQAGSRLRARRLPHLHASEDSLGLADSVRRTNPADRALAVSR
jgi:hypothetical protein